MARAVLLLSGGLDSYTAGAMMRAQGLELFALTVRYGQVHSREVEAARNVARALGVVRHIELPVDLAAFGGSALVGDGRIPKDRQLDDEAAIPSTYVPARNTVFLSLALAWAEVLEARDIVIGVNALDYSGYPDCRPAFIHAFESLATCATRAGVEGARFRVRTPLINLTKAEIIKRHLQYMIQKTVATPTAATPTAVSQAAATPTVATHTASREARRPRKKRRKAWYRQQELARGATQAETPSW